MPPHCDSLDGPVVTAARQALELDTVAIALPFVPKDAEAEVVDAFETTARVRLLGAEARALADRWFSETVVRLHRMGEGAAYTGLKPARLDVGPVIPAAERALETGSPDELVSLLCEHVANEVRERLSTALELHRRADARVDGMRGYVESALGLQVWAHSLYRAVGARPHEHAHA